MSKKKHNEVRVELVDVNDLLRMKDDEPTLQRNRWQSLPKGTPIPFSDVPQVGITKIQNKPVMVVDWILLRDYFDDRGAWIFAGYAVMIVDCDGEQVKVKASSPMMISRLKQERDSFQAVIHRGSAGFIFANKG